jgi:dTDP-4-dehydrorhamnose 3,5-epimerase
MIFIETPIAGVFLLDPERRNDERGFFARTWCLQEYERRGLVARIAQVSTAHNEAKGTLRGMHWQDEPNLEAKTIRCTAGAIFDVVVDVRAGSATYLQWFGTELSQGNGRQIYIPPRCAHGYVTLGAATDVEYQISSAYAPESSRGIRWDDPRVGVRWPMQPTRMSERDATFPLLEDNPSKGRSLGRGRSQT